MPTTTTYSPTLDGRVRHEGTIWSWDTGHDATDGTAANYTSSGITTSYATDNGNNAGKYKVMFRSFLLFDTSNIPSGNVVTAATLHLVALQDSIANAYSDSITVTLTNPASTSAIVVGDWDQAGGKVSQVHQSADVAISSITANSSTYTVFTLNAAGRSNVSKTGISKFGIATVRDVDDQEPTWANDQHVQVNWASSNHSTSGIRPYLTVTHELGFTPKAIIF